LQAAGLAEEVVVAVALVALAVQEWEQESVVVVGDGLGNHWR